MALLGGDPDKYYKPTMLQDFIGWLESIVFSGWFAFCFLMFIAASIFGWAFFMAHRAGL